MSLLNDSDLDEINRKIINCTIEKCSKFYNARILEAIKTRWIKLYEKKKKFNQETVTKSYNKPTEAIKNNSDNESVDQENDFEGAEVEEKKLEDSKDVSYSDDELDDLDNISISDLSDVDPPTDDIIVAACEKLNKPSGRRRTNTTWKLKLKGGIMKIAGKEMFFSSLHGELGFS